MRTPRNRCPTVLHAAGIGLLLMLSLGAAGVRAQDASTYYTVQHPEKFKIDWAGFYRQAEAKTAAVRAELPHHLNLPYGKNVKQRLDLYLPVNKPDHAPVFLFLHGGGFREGDRAQYGFVAKPFAAHGVITAVASYRLTGDGFKYPDQPEDAQHAIEWLYRNIAKYGGDPERLYIGGHSAGAMIAASVGVDRAWLTKAGIPAQVLRGIIPVSGVYDLRTHGATGEEDAYAPTAQLQAGASSVLHIVDPTPDALIAYGTAENLGTSKETDTLVVTSQQLADKLKSAGVHAELMVLKDKDHRGTVLALGDESSDLFHAAIRMIDSSAGAAQR